MSLHELNAIKLNNLVEFYRGNPIVDGRHVVDAIHAENPDVVFPQIPKLMKLKPSPTTSGLGRRGFAHRQKSLASSSSHTPPQDVLALCPDALNDFIKNTNKSKNLQKKTRRHIIKDLEKESLEGGVFYNYLSLAYEELPYLTPREVVFKQLAAMPHYVASRHQTTLKSSYVDAFVLNHEVGHKISQDFGLADKGEMDGASSIPEFRALQQKKDQVNKFLGDSEPYGLYLEEAFSDTFAALQHLKNGGNVDFIETIQDAREVGFSNSPRSSIYPTHLTLSAVTENAETLQEKLMGASQEDVVRMAAGIVGEHSYDREEYYEHAVVAQAHAISDPINVSELDWEQIIQDKEAPVRELWEGYCSSLPSRPTGFWAMFSRKDDNLKSINQFFVEAYAKHGDADAQSYRESWQRLTNAPHAEPEHLQAELLGHLKYIASKYPEKTPEMLLREREAYLREIFKENGKEVPQYMRDANDGVRKHFDRRRAENLNRGVMAIARDESQPESPKALTPER